MRDANDNDADVAEVAIESAAGVAARNARAITQGADAVRFHVVPRAGWDACVRGMKCSVRNCLTWKGRDPLPVPPSDSCWLLASSDSVSLAIARRQRELCAQGWKLLTSDPEIISRLSDKALLNGLAEEIGCLQYLPQYFQDMQNADYPCILKSANGEFGKDCHIVQSADDVLEKAPKGLGSGWVLQELVPGRFEYSASLLVDRGVILDVAATCYEAACDAFVWPQVQKVGKAPYGVPKEHVAIMQRFLEGYTGLCNFNYKVRPNGDLAIFEVNTRMGGDFACDVPRATARRILEQLDRLEPSRPV